MLSEALSRMPHAGAMRLIGAIESADETRLLCSAKDHSAEDYPLRLDGMLYAATLVELGAQAAAAHASVFGVGAAHTGLVLSVGNVTVHCDLVEGAAPLRASAERLGGLDAVAEYRFAVTQDGADIVSGELLLSMRKAQA